MKKLFILIFIAAACLADSTAHAQPIINSVNGSPSPGSQLTIQGSGFGEKSTADPIRFNDFQEGQPGDLFAPDPDSGWLTFANAPEYSNAFQYVPDDITCKQSFGPNSNGSPNSGRMELRNQDLNQVYFSGVVFIDRPEGYSEFEPQFVRLFGHYEEGYSSISGFVAYPAQGPESGKVYSSQCETQEPGAVAYGPGLPASGEWHRIEFWHGFDTDETENLFLKVDGASVLSATSTNPGCDHSIFSLIPTYVDPDNQSAMDFYWSSIYVDNTLARVEIGDAPEYEDCSHREIQIPSYWSEDQIEIQYQEGSFQVGEQLYLFVIDGYGVVGDWGFALSAPDGPPGTIPPPYWTHED